MWGAVVLCWGGGGLDPYSLSVTAKKHRFAGAMFWHVTICSCFCNDFFNYAQRPRGSKPILSQPLHCLMYTLLGCWERSRENTSGFPPFVFACHITQFTYKYGLSCPFSMSGPQTNLPLALIWKMSLLSQGNRIILNNGKRQNHIIFDKKGTATWEDDSHYTVWAGCNIHRRISRAELVVRFHLHANRAARL